MKREIKFRAWIPNTGWLAEGFSIAMDGTEWYDDNGHSWPVCDLEIMQFTGLKDKNGKEIYEGDILTGEYVVTFYEGAFGFWGKENSIPEFYMLYRYLNIKEVIGNIYENPELLKA